MSARGNAWGIGLLVTAGLAASSAMASAPRGMILLACLVGLALTALVAEAVAALMSPSRVANPPGATPADGIVDVVPMAGVETVANPSSPRFWQFLGRRDKPGEPARVVRLPKGHPPLLGRIALISVFVGRDGKGWTSEEIARGHEALERAGLWLEREASRHAAFVNIGLVDTYFRVQDDEVDEVEVAFVGEGGDVGPMEAHASIKAIVAASRAASTLGFADVVDWLGKVNTRVDADARAWLFHLRRSGRSLAIPAHECEVDGVGLALCFSREASFPGPLEGPGRVDPTTVAHELLHLFGASDKYGVPLRSFPPGTVSPRDIMRLNHDRLSSLTIDPLTASEVGWKPIFAPELSTKKARRWPDDG